MTCAAGCCHKDRGAAFGIMFTGSSPGGIIFPITVPLLIRDVVFPWALRTCAFPILALLVITNLTVKAFVPTMPKPVTAAQLLEPFKEIDSLLVLASLFLFAYGFFIHIYYLPRQTISEGISTSLTQYLVAMFNAGVRVGRLIASVYTDKVGRYNIFMLVSCFSGI